MADIGWIVATLFLAGCGPQFIVESPPPAGALEAALSLQVTPEHRKVGIRGPAYFAGVLEGPLRRALKNRGFRLRTGHDSTQLVVHVVDAGHEPGVNRTFCELSVRTVSSVSTVTSDTAEEELSLRARYGYRAQSRFTPDLGWRKGASHCARRLAERLKKLRDAER